MNDIDLKKILENYQEMPPTRCWEAVEKGLEAMATTTGAAASASASVATNTATTAAKSSSIISSIFGSATNAIIAVTTTVVIATAAIATLVVLNNEPAPPTSPQDVAPVAIITEVDTTVTLSVIEEEEIIEVVIEQDETEQPTPSVVPADTASNVNRTSVSSSETVADTPEVLQTPTQSSQINNTPTEQTAPIVAPKVPNLPTKKDENPVVDPLLVDKELPVYESIKLSIPNIFTPNGDFYNETFAIEGIEHCENVQLVVRANNGQLVYQSKHYDNSWNGENCPDGVYDFILLYSHEGRENKIIGTIIIQR